MIPAISRLRIGLEVNSLPQRAKIEDIQRLRQLQHRPVSNFENHTLLCGF